MTDSPGKRVPKDGLIWPFEMNAENRKAAVAVAQVFNLLYRRFAIFAIGKALKTLTRFEHTVAPQNGILRYSRFKTCATRTFPTRFIIDPVSIVFVRFIFKACCRPGYSGNRNRPSRRC